MQLSEVVALDNTFSISNPTIELWELSDSASEISFALKMSCWHQPTGPREPFNYWSREIRCSLHYSFYKYNHLCSQTWKVFFIAYCTVYCTVHCTAYCIIYCTVYIVLYTEYYELNTLYARNRTVEQIIFERRHAKGFASNVEGDGPLTSAIRYISNNYTTKHRRLSSKPLKREAASALDEPPF